MDRKTLNKLEDIGFKITFTLVITAFTIWFIGTIVKLIMICS